MGISFHNAYLEFPDPARDDVDELLAMGGDLEPERLLAAYCKGIFPWYDASSPILWWSPDPRLILLPEQLYISRRLARTLRQGDFQVSVNMSCPEVIRQCAYVKRKGARGTWLVPEMIDAYCTLHELGFVHSVEAWQGDDLVGGIYGVSLGRAFFGESMFHRVSNASKVALVTMVHLLQSYGVHFMDCQQTTSHLLSFGAREVPRKAFVRLLDTALDAGPTQQEMWRTRFVSIPHQEPAGEKA